MSDKTRIEEARLREILAECADALDYPKLDPALFICWVGNNAAWPHADRRTLYLSATRKDVMKGSALYTPMPEQARTFKTKAEANAWMLENRKKRGQDYDGLQITTVAELVRRRFPEPKAPAKKAKTK